jgi:hypothetical protein
MIEMMREIRKLQDQIDALRTIEVGGIWKTWTPTLGGFSANPTNSTYVYTTIGNTAIVSVNQGTSGTSNDTIFTITSPVIPSLINGAGVWSYAVDNGTALTTPGRISVAKTTGIISLFKDSASGAWTNSGNKRAIFTVVFEIG